MRRYAPIVAFVAGIAVVALLMPRFNAAQPAGIRLTRGEAIPIADAAARAVGIPVDSTWAVLSWQPSYRLEKQLDPDPDLRRRAAMDPILGPRLRAFRRMYYRRGLEKYPPYGYVTVDARTGDVLSAVLMLRNEEAGGKPTQPELQVRADAFVHSRRFPGAPNPQFESARPTEYRSRTDWTFRYRVKSDLPIGNVVPYLVVQFAGDRFAGWRLDDEYADGSQYRSENSDIGGIIARYATFFALLLILLTIFLKKYHAGEAGVGTASILFAIVVVFWVTADWIMAGPAVEGSNTGSLDAQTTALVYMIFKFLLYDLVFAVLTFFAWSVGESYARERWGERLASFDALLRRDPLNATTGRSVLVGVLWSPAVAAGAFAVAFVPLALHIVHLSMGIGTDIELDLGGPLLLLLFSALDAVVFPLVALFLLAWTHRRRVLPVGIAAALALAMMGAVCDVPTDPFLHRVLFDFGGMAVAIAVFLFYDLLAMAISLFLGGLITMAAPLLSVAQGHQLSQLVATIALPAVALLGFGAAALLTRREVVYTYEDLAPHVRRIVERERVKAEIDAANRIQAALLPVDAPYVRGASVVSHYRAATEIGGDYFDFLPMRDGDMGIAFGDVAGHGLTSGIVMAMAKSALLVQVDVDPAPRIVLEVLNEIVMKTAPRRMMMTFFFGLLEPNTHRLRFASAGHLDPYVFRARHRRLEPLSSWGFPLGVRRRDPFREHTVQFAPGDRLILYSDGLIEAVDDDGEPFGFERFERVLIDSGHLSAEEIKKTLLGSVRKFTRNRPPEDDQTLVVVSFDAPAGVEEVTEAEYATAT
ncbi:MAG TPA: PP2C family protein-serine/threonine phosphatase [Thermoanaerobaculia bacterium]|nr:PP2C family protein-serine/threonine phosphatase [Thermoanaerobaculia bacterium]